MTTVLIGAGVERAGASVAEPKAIAGPAASTAIMDGSVGQAVESDRTG